MAETSIMEPTKAEQSPAPKASVTSKPRRSRFGWLLMGVLVVAARVGAFYLSRSGNGGSGHGREGARCRGFIAIGRPVAKRHGGQTDQRGHGEGRPINQERSGPSSSPIFTPRSQAT